MSHLVLMAGLSEDASGRVEVQLTELGHRIYVVAAGTAVPTAIRAHDPSLVLVEHPLEDMPGTELIRRLRADEVAAELPIVVVSERSDEIDRIIAFEIGADDFVPAPFSARELALRIHAILRRSRRARPSLDEHLTIGPFLIDIPGHQVAVDGEPVELTALEFRLLLDLASRRGRVQRRDELLERVWRYPGEVETRTVDTHVKRLREKLGAAGRWIETVRGVGYRLRDVG